MKLLLSLAAISFLVISSHVCLGQNRFSGRVVEIIDGKTVVIETSAGRITGELQYVDVPEPEQPLAATVKQHLATLSLDRMGEFQVYTLTPGMLTGRLIISGVDINQQMLRDGAAWLIPAEKTGQTSAEFADYQLAVNAAKKEQLGIWSIPNLRPAWLIREEKEEKLRREIASRPKPQAQLDITSPLQTITRPDRLSSATNKLAIFEKDAWLDVLAGTDKETPGIKVYNDPKGRFTSTYTSVAFVTLAVGQTKQRLECRAIQGDFQLLNGGIDRIYLFGFRAISDDYNFSTRISRLSVTADGQTVSMALMHGLRGRAQFGAAEIMYFQISRRFLQRIATAKNPQLRIDKLSGPMSKELQGLIAQLLASTN